jgi:hypothetical protein
MVAGLNQARTRDAAPAPEPSIEQPEAEDTSAPTLGEKDAAVLNIPPPKPPQAEAGPSGEKQVEDAQDTVAEDPGKQTISAAT